MGVSVLNPQPAALSTRIERLAGPGDHYFFVAQDKIRVWDGASEAYSCHEQTYEPQYIDEYSPGGVVSVAGKDNDRIEFWPDLGGGADACLILERTILIDNAVGEPIVGVAPGPNGGVILAFPESGVVLFDADGDPVAGLVGTRSQRGIGALDVDRCGSAYAAETGQPDFPPQVLKAVPSYKDPGCFLDSSGVFENAITKMGRSRITVGCNPPYNDRYCPDRDLTRGEIAAFFARALKLPVSTVDYFTDDNGHLFEGAINRIAEAGITSGCNPPANNHFCPDQIVNRGQSAALFARAFDL